MAKILPSGVWSAFCYNHAGFSMWKTGPRELITEVTIWEWLMNKAEISCFLSGALKQMSHSGNFLLSINGKAQLAREKWLWVSCERRREKESTPSLWKVCDILKELWRWIMTGLINSSLLFSLSYGNLFCHSVMRISLRYHKDQAPLIQKNHHLLKDVVFWDKLQYSCLFFSFFCRREYIRFMRSRIISLEGLERKTPKP